MRAMLLLTFTLLLSLAAAAAERAPASCPPKPTRVVRNRGGVIDYLGTTAGIADLCRETRTSDGTGEFYMGAWRSDWPGAGEAYPAIKQVLAGPPGAKATFITRSWPGFQFTDSYINNGFETLTINGKPYRTVMLAHERQGIEGNTYHSIITSWRDVATGMTLKARENQISGQSYGPDTTWEAVRVEALPPG